jgi:hypothetical protein
VAAASLHISFFLFLIAPPLYLRKRIEFAGDHKLLLLEQMQACVLDGA